MDQTILNMDTDNTYCDVSDDIINAKLREAEQEAASTSVRFSAKEVMLAVSEELRRDE